MAHLDDFKQIARDTMDTITDRSLELYKIAEEKTKILAKTAKLSAEITLEKGALRKLYRELGELYYVQSKDQPPEGAEQLFAEIAASLEKIAAKQQDVADLKTPCPDFDEDDDPEDVFETGVNDARPQADEVPETTSEVKIIDQEAPLTATTQEETRSAAESFSHFYN